VKLKKIRAGAIAATTLAAIGGATLIAIAPASAIETVVPDTAFAACVNNAIDSRRPADTPITVDEIASVRIILCNSSGVTSLEGLEHASSLERLRVYRNPDIATLAPLAGATALRALEMQYAASSVTDLSPLTGLPLETLDMNGSPVSDLSPIADMTTLKSLTVNDAELSDISHLANLVNLEELSLNANMIADASVLAHLPKLRNVILASNQLTNAVGLESDTHPGLVRLNLYGNNISDISAAMPTHAFQTGPAGYNGTSQWVEDIAYVPLHASDYTRGIDFLKDYDSSLPTATGQDSLGNDAFNMDQDHAITWPVDATRTFDGAQYFLASFSGKTEIGGYSFGSSPYSGLVGLRIVQTDFADYPENGALGQSEAGQEYTHKFTLNSDFPVTSWTAKNLPAGLSLSDSGVVSGTLSTAGTHHFKIEANDVWGNQVSRDFSLVATESDTVTPGPEQKPTPGDSSSTSSKPALANTGSSNPTLPIALIALGAVALGSTALIRARQRSDESLS